MRREELKEETLLGKVMVEPMKEKEELVLVS